MRLSGKTAIVTGAGAGLGRAIALLFAAQGARVMVAEIDRETGEQCAQEIVSLGRDARFIQTDTADPAHIASMVTEAIDTYGQIDVLVNNAGIGLRKPFTDITDADWDRLFSINLKGYFRCCQQVIPHMKEAGRGSIINISSVHAFSPEEQFAAYAAAKGGIVSLTKALAVEYGKDLIRANAICPGLVMTQTSERVLRATGMFEQMVNGTLQLQCIPRMGTEDDVAQCALFFASDESSFITGQVVSVDGGSTTGRKLI